MDPSSDQEAFLLTLPETGRNSVSPYLSAVRLILKARGRDLPLTELLGLSGLCFHFSPGSISEQPRLIAPYEKLLFQALGFARYSILDPAAQLKQVKKNIRQGLPVLCYGIFGDMEWGVLTGYQGDRLLGKTCGSGIRAASRYPGTALRLFDQPVSPLSPRRAFAAMLQLCVDVRTPQNGEADYAAYFGWISALRRQSVFTEQNRRRLFRLAGTRQAAADFLKSRQSFCRGANRRLLLDSAQSCTKIAALAANSAELPPRQLDMALRQVLTLEKEIEYNFRFILEHWKR